MSEGCLIDLYVPASGGALDEWSHACDEARLDALVYVGQGLDGWMEAASAVSGHQGASEVSSPRLFPGGMLAGENWRLLVLVPVHRLTEAREALEGIEDPSSIISTVEGLGGCALPACPRHEDDGGPRRERCAPVKSTSNGWLTLTAGGSLLGRDLALEDCFAAGGVVLAGTGPFGSLVDMGRLATYIPVIPEDLSTLIAELKAGSGAAVERTSKEGSPSPKRDAPQKKRRRRRRRRGPKSEGSADDGGGAPPSSS
ncbi:MAG: hypothetical protein VX938_13845 [Myxococcota bacterium]|nr:hypothetical protein [Myxococcota bacterium]